MRKKVRLNEMVVRCQKRLHVLKPPSYPRDGRLTGPQSHFKPFLKLLTTVATERNMRQPPAHLVWSARKPRSTWKLRVKPEVCLEPVQSPG